MGGSGRMGNKFPKKQKNLKARPEAERGGRARGLAATQLSRKTPEK
jgi:hypothetical protein